MPKCVVCGGEWAVVYGDEKGSYAVCKVHRSRTRAECLDLRQIYLLDLTASAMPIITEAASLVNR